MTAEARRPLIESSCLFTNIREKKPMSKFKLTCPSFLDDIVDRTPCPVCNRSRRYFCYNCYVPVLSIKDKLPCVRLPVDIDIIKHPKEVEGKSTAIHAAVLAPHEVKVHIYPDVPDYSNLNVLLVFPGKNAKTMKKFWETEALGTCTKCNFHIEEGKRNMDITSLCRSAVTIDKIVFIDSTWRQTKRLYGDERLNHLPCIVLEEYDSLFWRHQRNKPMSHLSTVEAIYYFLVELDATLHPGRNYLGQYDDILFFFNYMYGKIRRVYDSRILEKLKETEIATSQPV